jgi:hypothetical protein
MPRKDESAFRSDAIESTDSPRVAWTCGTAAKTVRAKHMPSNNLENFLVFMMVVSSLVSDNADANLVRNASKGLFLTRL